MKTLILILIGILFTNELSNLSTELKTPEQIKLEQSQLKKVDSIAIEIKKIELKMNN
jgi:hypothetical protein